MLRGEGHAGWEHGQGHELTRRHGGVRHFVRTLRRQWSSESRCEQNKQYQVSESHRNTPPRGESRQSLAQRCGRFQSDKGGGARLPHIGKARKVFYSGSSVAPSKREVLMNHAGKALLHPWLHSTHLAILLPDLKQKG